VRRLRPSAGGAWSLLRAGVPIGIAGLLLTVLLRIDVVLLSFLGDNQQVGLYAAGYRLIDGLQFLSWSFGAAMLPWLTRAATGRSLARAFMLCVKLEAAVLLPIGLVLSCFARPIVQLLYGHEFAGAAAPLTLLGGTVVCYGLYRFGATVMIARDSAGTLARTSAAVAVFNIVGNLVAIPLAAARGAAAVALATGVLLAALNLHFASRRTGGLRVVRAFCAPAVAAAAMVAVAVTVPLPAIPAGAIALAVYGLVLAGIELALHRDDLRAYARALPAPLRLKLALR
jgi:O-antigen/teichoic acid export membrane protein